MINYSYYALGEEIRNAEVRLLFYCDFQGKKIHPVTTFCHGRGVNRAPVFNRIEGDQNPRSGALAGVALDAGLVCGLATCSCQLCPKAIGTADDGRFPGGANLVLKPYVDRRATILIQRFTAMIALMIMSLGVVSERARISQNTFTAALRAYIEITVVTDLNMIQLRYSVGIIVFNFWLGQQSAM